MLCVAGVKTNLSNLLTSILMLHFLADVILRHLITLHSSTSQVSAQPFPPLGGDTSHCTYLNEFYHIKGV